MQFFSNLGYLFLVLFGLFVVVPLLHILERFFASNTVLPLLFFIRTVAIVCTVPFV